MHRDDEPAPEYIPVVFIFQFQMNRLSVLTLIVSGIAAQEVGDVCPWGGDASIQGDCSPCTETCIVEAISMAGCTEDAAPDCGEPTFHCACPDESPAPDAESPSPETEAPSPDSSSPDSSSEEKCTPAYDDDDYCLCPEPKEYEEDPEKMEVSVCGDATYLLDSGVIPCSGPVSEDAKGTGCPKKGDTTDIACRQEILSYLTGGKTGTCKAPEDATCEKLNTGAWGCVFPGNCNTVNTCLEQPVCTEEYEKDSNGTCVVMDNGYVKPAENNTALYDTTELSELKQKVDTGSASILLTSITALCSGIAVFALF